MLKTMKRKVHMKLATTKVSRTVQAARDDIRAAAVHIGALRESMTFLVPLSEAERLEHHQTRIVLQKLRNIATRLQAARKYREHLPEAFDFRGFERDSVHTADLADLLKEVEALRTAVHDTFLVTANRAAVGAQSVYKYI